MSKKKKNSGIWDLTVEEQERNAEEFYKYENGASNTIFAISNNIKEAPLAKNGLTEELAQSIVSDLRKKGKPKSEPIVVEEVTDTDNQSSISYSEFLRTVNESADYKDDEEEILDHVPFYNINLKIVYPLRRVVLDDGITPTTFSFDAAIDQEINDIDYNEEYVKDSVSLLYKYIISLKHPVSIMSIEKFFSIMKKVKSYNDKKYMFIATDGMVLCYMINTKTFDEFNAFMKDNSYPIEEVLRVYVSLSYTVGTCQNAFWIEEPEYLNVFMNDESLNRTEDFLKMFFADEPELLNEEDIPSDDDDLLFPVYDAEELQTSSRHLLTEITGEEYYDDEEDDEEEEEDEEEEPTNDSVEEADLGLVSPEMDMIDSSPVPEEVKVVAGEKPKEETKSVKPVEPKNDDSDDLVMNVVRRS